MISSIPTRALRRVKKALEETASRVNRTEIIKDIYAHVGVSSGYFTYLTLANLIALSGLLMNNASVIIGAMLISPLMGPILSSGFSFMTGNISIGRKAFKKLALSIVVTIAFAAIATYVSPLKGATQEILSRTHPNIYDLLIAVFAGFAGAISLCTKRDYVMVVTGVSIATAVIPPLSVTGYGVGSGQYALAVGGFFLFFTNLVAIIISTCIVFFIYGFRPMRDSVNDNLMSVKRRFLILGGTFVIISIPLVYTLHSSVSEINATYSIRQGLERSFNVERKTHLVSFLYKILFDGTTEINATVNTYVYMKEQEIAVAEKEISAVVGKPVKLNVDQILVHKGGLKEGVVAQTGLPVTERKKTFDEINRDGIDSARDAARRLIGRINAIIFPSSVVNVKFGYDERSTFLPVQMTIKRDKPVSEEERVWLQSIVSEALMSDVRLTVDTTPLVGALFFSENSTELTPDMLNKLTVLKGVREKYPNFRATIVIIGGNKEKTTQRLSSGREKALSAYLEKSYGITKKKLRFFHTQKKQDSGMAVIKVIADERVLNAPHVR